MDLDFDKYCLVDGSPTTVLPAPRYVNEIPSLSEDFEINFSHFSREFQSQRVSQEGNEVLRRGSIYHSSRELCETDERQKIATESALDFEILDSLCISDEDSFPIEEENTSQEKDLAVNLPRSPAKSRLNPVKKMWDWDPFVKSSIKRNRTTRKSLLNEDKDKINQYSPAHLRRVFKIGTKQGAPFFQFSDAYVAKTWKAENASNWVYTFHSIRKSSRESSTVGQMHVSCSQCTEFKSVGESKHFMVTEFVLYDASHPLALAKLRPGQEIAAIVIQAPLEKRESLKFKSGDREIDETPTNLLDLFQIGKAKEGNLVKKIDVVIPAGNHGSSIVERNGPSSLLDRWRLGGGCDCGGWDMACPLSVLSNPTVKIDEGQPLIDGQNPTQLFLQGKKDDTPTFTMRAIEDGKYAVDFHAQLSSLQAFSICIAMLHASEASAIVGPTRSKRTLHNEPSRIFADVEIKTILDGVEKEEKSIANRMGKIMPSFVLNPPFSPISRA